MYNFYHIKHTAPNRLNPDEFAAKELIHTMQDIRRTANWVRLSTCKYMQEIHRTQLRYFVGKLDGIYFGSVDYLIYRDGRGYDLLNDLYQQLRNEADFLTGSYLYG